MVRKATVTGLLAGAALGLSLAFSPVRPASAQQNITWTTGFQVQNLSSTSAANVTITLIKPDGSTAGTIPADPSTQTETIAAGGANTYFPIPNVAAGFSGSAIISADQPVAAILNLVGNAGSSPLYNESVTGISNGSPDVRLPLILRGNGGDDTWFSVQNVGDAAASVKVKFTPITGFGNSFTTTAVNVPPGASTTFDQSTQTELGDRFVGSAQVIADEGQATRQPLAVIVNQVGKATNNKVLYTYSGFAGGTNQVAIPLVQQANNGSITGISIQNSGSAATKVTVKYTANLVSGGVSLADDVATLQPGASTVFLKSATDRYVGGATVTAVLTSDNTSPGEVVVVVNQLVAGSASAYEGFSTADATPNVSLPLLLANNGGTKTGVQCINLGAATTFTITYSPNKVTTDNFNPTAFKSGTIQTGAALNVLQDFDKRYVGGGTVAADNGTSNVVCIVNQVNSIIAGDLFQTYDGINYTP